MAEEKNKFSLTRALFAEAFATFTLAFVDSTVSIVDAIHGGSIGVFGRSMAATSVVITMIFLIGEVSGAHLNPAVTLSFALRRVFPWKRIPLYWGVQLIGAISAGFILHLLFGEFLKKGLTEPSGSIWLSFSIEILLSWFLITSINTSSCAHNVKSWQAAFPVGATLLFCGLVGKEISGASMNPARSLGPAFFIHSDRLWIYLISPFLGCVLGVFTVFMLRGGPSPKELDAAQGK